MPANAPAKKQSSENQSSPKPSSSARRAVWTMRSGGMWLPSTIPTGGPSGTAELCRRRQHGLHDLLVARAAAEVPGQRQPHLVLGRLGPLVEQGRGRDQHARRAEAALDAARLDERALESARLAAARGPLHPPHLTPAGLQRQVGA